MVDNHIPWIKLINGQIILNFEGNAIQKSYSPEEAYHFGQMLIAIANVVLKKDA